MQPSELLSQTLDDVLGGVGSKEDLRLRERQTFEQIAGGVKKVVIFGCGHLGRCALAGVTNAGLELVAFADNNQAYWGGAFEGIPVLSPAEAVHRHGGEAFFLVSIYNPTPPTKQLQALGCKRIVPYASFFWHFAGAMPAEDRLELPHRIVDHVDPMRHGYDLLADEASRREFAAQIRWRTTLDYDCLPQPRPGAETYFPPDLIRLQPDEVFADCGAFDGDSVRMFLDKANHSFRHIYAIEPDPINRVKLEQFLTTLPPGEASRISVLPFGVSDKNGTVSFNVTGSAGSSIVADGGTVTLECRRLDDILDGPPPSFIKMDIEGAEPFAIQGATETIRRARPIMAVCAYHKCEHLWTIPTLLKEALPDYQVSLHRYAEECWELVYYAVPPERAIRA